jgi:hypothetical protein
MKVAIPENLKADVPLTTWGKVLSATPVVMAVVATMLAGLSSSEMTRAQYARSLAAQQQSKAGDQWGFFQAKRLRGAFQRGTSDILEIQAPARPLDPVALRAALASAPAPNTTTTITTDPLQEELLALLDAPGGRGALDLLVRGAVPAVPAAATPDPAVRAALDAVEDPPPDAEFARILAAVKEPTLTEAVRAAREAVKEFDRTTEPVNQAVEQIANRLNLSVFGTAEGRELRRDFLAARLRYQARRYETEARLNQAVAGLYEVQVRKSNLAAERHHARSQRFFFGMLGAQTGVIIATFAIAARKRNLLWALAAAAGVVAVLFAAYVYLYT